MGRRKTPHYIWVVGLLRVGFLAVSFMRAESGLSVCSASRASQARKSNPTWKTLCNSLNKAASQTQPSSISNPFLYPKRAHWMPARSGRREAQQMKEVVQGPAQALHTRSASNGCGMSVTMLRRCTILRQCCSGMAESSINF